MDIISNAIDLATRSHAAINQVRKYTGDPYICHPRAVAAIVASVPHTPEMIAAAWLHDVVEDTPTTIEDVRAACGDAVANLVAWLTDVSRPSDGNRATRKALDRAHSAASPPEAQTIKLADLIDNAITIDEHDPDFAVMYRREKMELLKVMIAGDKTLYARASALMPWSMTIIDHPETFKAGTRVMFLRGRHKDNVIHQRMVHRVTHSVEQFDRALKTLKLMAQPHERIYASAGERDVHKAARKFKEMQLSADYDNDPLLFYRTIDARWASALMAPTSQVNKMWLFDCDSAAQFESIKSELDKHYDRDVPPYSYSSKSGTHIIVRPFNRTLLTAETCAAIHENPIMLWGY